MERPTHQGLRHLALNARDLDAMKRFYVELLGFAVEWEPDADNIYLSSGIDNLALHRTLITGGSSPPSGSSPASGSSPPSGSSPSSPSSSALDHLGLIVRSADDVDRWASFLQGRGVPISAKPRTHRDGARSFYFKDPDGNSIQIIHHPPISAKV